VFSVWTKPEHLARWWGPKDFTLPFCEQDFRTGGKYRLCMRSPEGIDYWLQGVYREIVEPERIVFTWDRAETEGAPGAGTIVTVTFAEQGEKTLLTLHQAIFQSVDDCNAHQGGWSQCLDRLVQYVESSSSPT